MQPRGFPIGMTRRAVLRRILLCAALPLWPYGLRAQETPPSVAFSTATVFGPENAQGTSIAVGPSGNAYVLSLRFINGISLQVSKYSPQGDKLLWSVNLAGAGNAVLFPGGIAVDGAGNAYVAYTDVIAAAARVAKYDGSGNAIKSAPAPFGAAFFPSLTGIVFDPATGRVYAAGTAGSFIFIAEYDGDLNAIGSPAVIDDSLSIPSISNASGGIAVDGAGNVYAGGTQFGPINNGYLAVKYSPHLQMQLYKQSFLSDARFRFLRGVGADPAGNVYAVGDEDTADGTSSEGAIVRLDKNGGPRSFGPFRSGGSRAFDIFSSVKADADGNGYVAGFSYADNGAFSAIRTLKYSPAGGILWNVTRSPASFFDDFGVALDAQKNVYVTGGGNTESVAIKYRQGAGALSLAAESPSSQDATATKISGQPLKIKLTEGGQPKPGVTVRWDFISLPAGTTGQDLLEAPGFPSTVVASRDVPTDANGESAVQVKLGNMTGDYLVAAQAAGATPEQVAFTLHGQLFFKVALSTYSVLPVTGPYAAGYVSDLNKTTVTVTAYGTGGISDTVGSYPVILRSTYVVFSGAHNHEDGHRPIGIFEPRPALTSTAGSMTGQTGADGVLTVVYRSSWTGGFEVLTASSANDGNMTIAVATVTVTVSDLELLENATYYSKAGGTKFHAGPAASPATVVDANHWGQPEFNQALRVLAAKYRDQFASADKKLKINDISLSNGGLLDIGPTGRCFTNQTRTKSCVLWLAPHAFHRLGTSADINVSLSDGSTLQLNASLNTPDEKFLWRQLQNHPILRVHVEGDHWHIFANGGGPQQPVSPQGTP